MLQMPNASAMLNRGDSTGKKSPRIAGSNAKGIKSIHSMIHRDVSHEKLRGKGSAEQKGGTMDLDAPYLS